MATSAKSPKKPGTRKRRGVSIKPVALPASEIAIAKREGAVQELAEQVERDGGSVIGSYRDPLGGHALLFVALPIERVSPTPFQRDVSDAHVRKLTRAMDKTKRFLDPIIVVRQGEQYLTPNGNHRLTAMKELGAHAIVGLLVPEPRSRTRSSRSTSRRRTTCASARTKCVRMYRDLGDVASARRADCELEFEEPALVTLGFAYEQRGRLSGGAYHPALRKVDGFLEQPLRKALAERERRAARVLELDDAVNDAVARLKERGLTSPYLRSFVVARINPLRFIKGELPEFDELLDTMTKRARGMKTDTHPGLRSRAQRRRAGRGVTRAFEPERSWPDAIESGGAEQFVDRELGVLGEQGNFEQARQKLARRVMARGDDARRVSGRDSPRAQRRAFRNGVASVGGARAQPKGAGRERAVRAGAARRAGGVPGQEARALGRAREATRPGGRARADAAAPDAPARGRARVGAHRARRSGASYAARRTIRRCGGLRSA